MVGRGRETLIIKEMSWIRGLEAQITYHLSNSNVNNERDSQRY